MSMRRRAWWLAMVCVAAVGGCASNGAARARAADKTGDAAKTGAGGVGGAGGTDATTESLIARSAAGLDRVLSGEQKRQEALRIAGEAKRDVHDPAAPAQQQPAVQVEAPVRAAEPTAAESASASTGAAPDAVADPAATAAKPGVLSGWWASGAGASVEGQGAAPASSGVKPVPPSGTAAGAFWHGSEGDESAQMRISALALCTRVEGFGKVVKADSVRATGRPVPLLIYTQVDGFSCRQQRKEGGSGENEWVIELGQSVVVYRLSADGKGDVQVKVEPEQTARDVAAFKRRDHYLVQRIELPTPLVSGKYAVKVTVRDKKTGMVDEKVAEVVVR